MAVPTLTANSNGVTTVIGSIAWGAFTIRYGGASYAVPASSTTKKFTYWLFNAGAPILDASDTLPDLGADDLLLFLNKNGTPVNAQAASILDGSLIVPESILTDALSANSVTGEKILAGEINATHIQGNSITANEIASNAITANELAANAVYADAIQANAVTVDKIAANSIDASKIQAGTITGDKLNVATITADKITANSITQTLLTARPGGGAMSNIVPDPRFRDAAINAKRLAVAANSGGNTTGWAQRSIPNLLPNAVGSWVKGTKVATISSILADPNVPTSLQILYTLNANLVVGDLILQATVNLTDLTNALDFSTVSHNWKLEYLNASNTVLRTDTGNAASSYSAGSNGVVGNVYFHATSPQWAVPPAGTTKVRVSLLAAQALTYSPAQTYTAGGSVLWTTAGVSAEPGQGVFYYSSSNPATMPMRYATIAQNVPLSEREIDVTVGVVCTDGATTNRDFFVQVNYQDPSGTTITNYIQTYLGRQRSTQRFPKPPPGATQCEILVGSNYSPTPNLVEIYGVELDYVTSIFELDGFQTNIPGDKATLYWNASTGKWTATTPLFVCTARQTVAQSVGQAVYTPDWTFLNFGTQEEGSSGWSSGSPSRIVLPMPGQYAFSAGWANTWASNVVLDSILGVRLYNSDGTVAKQSVAEDRVNRPYSGSATISGSVKCTAAGQYLRVYVFHDPGGTLNTVPDNCFLSVRQTS